MSKRKKHKFNYENDIFNKNIVDDSPLSSDGTILNQNNIENQTEEDFMNDEELINYVKENYNSYYEEELNNISEVENDNIYEEQNNIEESSNITDDKELNIEIPINKEENDNIYEEQINVDDNTKLNIEESSNINDNKEENRLTKEQKQEPIYISFLTRILINTFVFVITLFASIGFIYLSFSVVNTKVVTYKESSNIDYKVYLKENSFYEDEYLGKNMSYISTLIDRINTTFNYNFSINENKNINFKYKIVGKLTIMDNTGKNVFYEKEYVLLDNKEIKMNNSKYCNIREDLDINYGYYNTIANDFRNKFGVSTTSNFVVMLKVAGESTDKTINIGDDQKMSLTIPLSQREVKIKLSSETLNNNDSIVKKSKLTIKNYLFLILSIITSVISIISLVKLIKKIKLMNTRKSIYDKYIEKILKEYDRFIANTTISPIINEGDKVIELNDFQELLDVRDNLKVPINYYIIVKHQKCLFYLNKDNLIYKYCVKAVDLENKN